MPFTVYKSGQGYWTRTLTAIGVAVLVLCGCAWLWQQLSTVRSSYTVYIQSGVAVGLIAFFGALTWFLLNKPRIADFMIATEAEMKKVNWPSKREIAGSTWVVISGTLMLALLLFIVDVIFFRLFQSIGILVGG